jgi:hypothetical protein
MLPTRMILFLIVIVGIPAYFINRLLMKTIRPKESFPRFLLYLLASLAIAFLYTWLGVFILLKFIWHPNK